MSDGEIISNIKSLGIDMINEAGSGHPGIVLGAAPILYCLYAYHLNINASDPNWFNRDRFVMSAGHGSALLYATLFMSGFSLSINDLKKFRHINSKTPGHPEVGKTPGIDCTTGALGQGIAMAVGMSLGEKILQERYRINSHKSLLDYNVYTLVGDGDLMEGISYEAASLAGALKLDNLIVLYDSNDTTLDGPIDKTFKEHVRARFEAMGWVSLFVKDGNSVSEINRAINKAKTLKTPVFIEIKTKIGEGSLKEGNNKVHSGPLLKEDIDQLKAKWQLPSEAFYYNSECLNTMRSSIASRVNDKYMTTNSQYKDYVNTKCEGDKTLANYMFNNDFKYNLFNVNWDFESHQKEATRDTNKMFIDYLNRNIKTFVGGSADVGSTTKTYIEDLKDITKYDYNGNNIWFGVREHAMGAILNGMALVNLKPFGSTFLSFADYLKPAMRFSALMSLPVIYIFSHDSINIGSDGPTHQPVEQLAMIRSIPKMKLFRPADAKELLGCWQVMLNSNDNPSALVLSRKEVEMHQNTDAKMSILGGYIYYKEHEELETIIIASGTELTYARNIGYELSNIGYNKFRIVSMPSIEQFLECKQEYRDNVLPPNIKKIVIEAGSSFGWHRISNNNMHYITIDTFGVSGTSDEVLEYMNFSYEQVKNRVIDMIKNK